MYAVVYPVILVRLEERNKPRTPAFPYEHELRLKSVKLKIYDLLIAHSRDDNPSRFE